MPPGGDQVAAEPAGARRFPVGDPPVRAVLEGDRRQDRDQHTERRRGEERRRPARPGEQGGQRYGADHLTELTDQAGELGHHGNPAGRNHCGTSRSTLMNVIASPAPTSTRPATAPGIASATVRTA
jgi:hypothetical protein